jgi:hypothetical protein
VAVDLGIVAMGHARSLTQIGKPRNYHSDGWTRPGARNQAGEHRRRHLWSSERSIGDRLGACGVVGTEVAVAVRYKAWTSGIVPLLGDHRLREGPGAFIIRSCCSGVGSAKPVSWL